MDTNSIVILAEMYGRHCNYKLSTVSTYAVNDGKRLPHLKNGGGCTVKTAERMMAWFDANWPRDLAWPRDIPRPTPNKQKKEAA